MAAVVERGVQGTRSGPSRTRAPPPRSRSLPRRADAALVNQQMPDLGGLQALRAIRDVQPECGVIITTSDGALSTGESSGTG